jgi:hypothetical protein
MQTEPLPRRKAQREEFIKSDLLAALPLPPDDRLLRSAKLMATALEAGNLPGVLAACADFLCLAADFYAVQTPGIQVLAARPRRVREGAWTSELFGDYAPDTWKIRVWMRTAVLNRVTSLGTFLSTLCHEFCHHLDYHRFKFSDSWHTRGFYARTAVLYHHARGTAPKELFWMKLAGGRWRIDWGRTRRGN